MKKIDVLVRFANEGGYYSRIVVDPKKIEKPMVFTDEVFFTIDNITVATSRDDWDKLK